MKRGKAIYSTQASVGLLSFCVRGKYSSPDRSTTYPPNWLPHARSHACARDDPTYFSSLSQRFHPHSSHPDP